MVGMSDGIVDMLTINIQSVIDGLAYYTPSKPCIFRVDSHLRRAGSDNVFEPEILAIGPYHHGNSRLQTMEQLKYRFLKQLLRRREEQDLSTYVKAVAAMEKRARICYSETLYLNKQEFVMLLLLDGCFLIELLRYCGLRSLTHDDGLYDLNFRHARIMSLLRRDVFLLENQLPFFVLNQLFNMTKNVDDPEDELITLALSFARGKFVDLPVSRVVERLPVKNIDHLVGLIHDVWCLPFAEILLSHNIGKNIAKREHWHNINSTCKLWEVGIKFEQAKGSSGSLMDIRFAKGVLRIPQLSIFDETESQFRNLIVYEQYLPNGENKYVSDYTFFMHCLINNSNDVELLRSRGIIENWLGDDQEVRLMFNRLGKNIMTSSSFCYSHVFCDVNLHCRRRANRWTANLRRSYFNSPWSVIKFLAAIALLVLTFTQTLFSVLAFYQKKG